jgi:hypothetical protein
MIPFSKIEAEWNADAPKVVGTTSVEISMSSRTLNTISIVFDNFDIDSPEEKKRRVCKWLRRFGIAKIDSDGQLNSFRVTLEMK